ncbi:MAG: SufE family protein [Bacteriovorax sp.]|nr:SufE family protein [Bacteriovorax sp.]
MTTEGIEQRIEKLKSDFKNFDEWEARYKHLIELGKKMPTMPDIYKIEENKIKGCQSQVWLHAELVGDKVHFSADSDASIVKGVIALLVYVYSEASPDEILMTKPTFLEDIGLREHLSMSRANGLASMVKQISFYAMAFKVKIQMSNQSR